jgi:hypothetical protein
MANNTGDSLKERLAKADRAIQWAKLEERVRGLSGIVGRPANAGEDISEIEHSFLQHVMAWETGPFSTHREWLARRGLVFDPPEKIPLDRAEAELWRLIKALAGARVFLYHTNHLSNGELYRSLWHKVLAGDAPDMARTPDDACHWDLACPGTEGEQAWLRFYATGSERREWKQDFPEVELPPHERAQHRRDHQLPQRS